MKFSQVKSAGFLFFGQIIIKLANFLKQILLAFFLGVSADIDIYLAAMIVPSILSSMVGGGAGEVLVTMLKGQRQSNDQFVVLYTFSIVAITLLISIIYLISVPIWINIFDISNKEISLYWKLSFIIVLTKSPHAIVAVLKNFLYYKNLYKYYVYTSIISEVFGIIAIILLVKSFGIIAFAIGVFITTSLNSILFFNVHGLKLKYIINKNIWIEDWNLLLTVLRKVFTVSLNVIISHLSTFTERVLSVRYLVPGYLSSLNYSKSLAEMPKMIMLSSILTTTYIEQVKQKEENIDKFLSYSSKIEQLLSQLSAAFQFLSIIFAPLILIVFFRRGEFDNSAVESTLIIYQILTIGFVPGLMMNFLSRTMYIIDKYRQLFFIILVKFIFEFTIMFSFINILDHSIPIALAAGKFFISIVLFIYIDKQMPGIFNKKSFSIIYIFLLFFTIFIIFVNQHLLPFLLSKTTFQIIIIYSPFAILSLIAFLYYLNRIGLLKPTIEKIKAKFHGKK